LKTRLPVRSALFKQRTGGLVVRWVTTSEYPLLYVFAVFSEVFELLVGRKAGVEGKPSHRMHGSLVSQKPTPKNKTKHNILF
jgi:hypothetical protein